MYHLISGPGIFFHPSPYLLNWPLWTHLSISVPTSLLLDTLPDHPRPGQAHHGLLSHTQLLVNVTLVTFEPLLLILPPLDWELLADCLAHSWPIVHVR